MNANLIKAGLQRLKKSFRRILQDGAEDVIDDAIAEIEGLKKRFDEQKRQTHDPHLTPKPWGYRIYSERPLRFKRSNAIKGLNLWVDLYCTVLWEEEGSMPVEQVIHLRVWSDRSNSCTYREKWDSDDVLDKLTNSAWTDEGRVMLRCHFDLSNPGQDGPKYHLQFGGNARGNELCWFPEIINLPRLAFHPMDLILVCQLVAANFYWEEYKEFQEAPEWVSAIRRSQEHLLKDYYRDCFTALDQDCVLLDRLWNI